MATVTFGELRKSYGSTEVLKGVSFDVADGEYIVLVGPSGCGKSTLLRCIAGLEDITSGDLSIGARRVNDVSPKDRDVAMVFQSYALYPHMTVAQNMGFALTVARRPQAEIDAAVLEVAKMLDLEHLLDRYPSAMSGGQRQRVAMGRAIVRRPSVFLFDEPLSNLDASLRNHMRVELKRLHQRLGTTVFHVTHDQVEALTLADRIVVLNAGVTQQVGTPRELFDRPANTFVATFIGSPAMNLVEANGEGTSSVIRASGQRVPVPAEGTYTLGIRPTDLQLDSEGPIAATVDVIESLGAEAILHLDAGGVPLVAQVPEPVELEAGAAVRLALRTVHRFDTETGERL